MGWLADLLQELPVSAALTSKLEKIEAEHERLKAELQQVKEENVWLKAELERMKGTPTRLQERTEKLLHLIANNPQYVEGNLFDHMQVSQAELDHHLDLLEQRDLIVLASVSHRGPNYSATPAGRQYFGGSQTPLTCGADNECLSGSGLAFCLGTLLRRSTINLARMQRCPPIFSGVPLAAGGLIPNSWRPSACRRI